MQNIPTNLLGFVLVLGFLIFAHESGHFFMAKLFRVRVLVFSFGFGKRLFGFQRGSTDYRVSLIPLGGYVRMAGDTPEENQPANPDEFLSRPKWQRFLILVAGPFMNLLIAVGFVAAISMIGNETLIIRPIVGEVTAGKPAARAGLTTGDRIVAINGETIDDWDDMRLAIGMHAGSLLRVDYIRNGQVHTTTMTPDKETSEFGPVGRAGILPYLDTTVGHVKPGSTAAAAGLRTGDRIVGVNGRSVSQLSELDPLVKAAKGSAIALDVARGEARFHATLAAAKPDPMDPYRGFMPPTEVHKLAFFPAIKDSVAQNWKMLRYTFITLGRLFRAEGSVKELSGPISIARISGEMLRRGWIEMVALMAMISLQLGVMNLLPIPVLDGGHIMILMIEGVARRDLSLRVKERIQQAGFAVLAALMLVVLYNDVITNVLLRKG
ncbi:MAG: regulator of sigma protease [Thermoanaerobaculia bacterium]|jgi:regulator of sigma E protease|nr:regulator of sigma protease [Thermoanaerobaculia bacterium]